MKTDKPREFWIVDHDLGDGKMLAKGTVMGSSIRPSEETISRFPDKLIHTIDFSAYEAVQKKLEIAINCLERINTEDNGWAGLQACSTLAKIEGD